jgi:xylan 1,4-beta-xylosidase
MAFRFAAETLVEVSPSNFQQAAGLICYYNATKFPFLQITCDDHGERQLQVLSAVPQEGDCSLVTQPIAVPEGPVGLRVEIDHEVARFAYRPRGSDDWCTLSQLFDASILSDEATLPGLPNFTAAFVGMACYDLWGGEDAG